MSSIESDKQIEKEKVKAKEVLHRKEDKRDITFLNQFITQPAKQEEFAKNLKSLLKHEKGIVMFIYGSGYNGKTVFTHALHQAFEHKIIRGHQGFLTRELTIDEKLNINDKDIILFDGDDYNVRSLSNIRALSKNYNLIIVSNYDYSERLTEILGEGNELFIHHFDVDYSIRTDERLSSNQCDKLVTTTANQIKDCFY